MPIREKLNVLVLEDDELDYRVLARHLESVSKPKYILHKAETVEEALQVLADNEIDVSLIDYRLSNGKSGIEFVREVGGREADFPLIMLTGMDSSALDKEAILSGAYDYIDKLSLSRELVDRAIRFAITSHEYERQLRFTSEKFEEQATLNRNILAVVSHEMKSPISSLIGYCDYLIENCGTQTTRDAVHKMKSATVHLEDFLRNLSEFVRLDSGAARISAIEFDLESMLSDTVSFFTSYTNHKGILIETVFDRSIEGAFIGDRLRIRQVLINIIKNAINYSDQGKITVTAKVVDEILHVEITDEGVGIPDSKLKIIKGDKSVRQSPGEGIETGLGLGLSISRRLLKLMQGQFTIESAVGFGTTAGFTVPLKSAKKAKAA